MSSMYDHGLGRRDANYEALTPVDFIARAAEVYGDRLAVVHGKVRRNWRQTYERAQLRQSALAQAGIKRGDTVAVMLPNIPAMVEAHFGVPMLGAVLNTLNTRLDTPSVLFMLGHGEARALIIDTEYAELAQRARAEFPHLAVISVHDLDGAPAALPGATDYEAFLAAAPPRSTGSRRPTSGRHRAELHVRHHRRSQGRGLSLSRRLPERRQQHP